ncbi:hypothetical protein BHY_0196 [Borrelia nietonii YOR]|uniref:Variable outer membrane protein n=1 Tax=Borrelia nietonii YOR TaxID=1293576 RepID=A0ABN4C8V1_9SPIR|nr:hypothetical protein BHY_0196 [Borrelia nietonii YOR]AHH13684.1 hypothetical protein BHW_0900075 [Borrelia hermsii MTW]
MPIGKGLKKDLEKSIISSSVLKDNVKEAHL